MLLDYQPNRPITGAYDPSRAVRCRNGTFVGALKDGVAFFRGIPFAKPPVGPLRWREPVPAEPSDGVFEALFNGPTAVQTELDSERASFYRQSEDCLYLNVWTADGFRNGDEKRPVMVFIHGGNYGWGGTADPLYDGFRFVKDHPDVVLVTVAYRVGIMGFMDFSEVPGGDAYASAGNLGLLDQICALRYVNENIRSFGGDPENVTLFGESAGGGSVSLLPLMPAAKGLFSRVIAESGSVALTYSREECLPLTRNLLKVTGAQKMKDLLALSEDQLKEANKKLNGANNFPERDGVLLPENPYEAYERGDALPVGMMAGTNADELRYWILDMGGLVRYRQMSYLLYGITLKRFSKQDRKRAERFVRSAEPKGVKNRPWRVTEFFNELLFRLPAVRQGELHAKNGHPVYLYYWEQPSSLPHLGACHAVELAYVFNNLDETIYTGEGVDAEVAARVQNMWVNFAKTGDPSADGLTWEPYSASDRRTMLIGKRMRTEKDLKDGAREALTPLLRYRVNGNSAVPAVDRTSVLKALAVLGLAVAAGLSLLLYCLLR